MKGEAAALSKGRPGDAPMNGEPASQEQARALAARVWSYRLLTELEAAQRFRALAASLQGSGASRAIVKMAADAADDELRHASSCRQLVQHFGGRLPDEPSLPMKPLAPPEVKAEQRLLYEVVALACVTETLSTALLAELIAPASDPLCKKVMRSILRDEVKHSQLGWAFLAEEHARGASDCVGPHLKRMLVDTLGAEFWSPPTTHLDAKALAGLGQLDQAERQRIVLATLQHVVFPGLERFGIDTTLGRSWCA
jgi:hypothetical protein